MAAHTLGNPMDMARLKAIADKHGLWLIEDCCDALGSSFNGQLCGTFGDLATLSFYPAHHITMGEGGAVFSNNISLMSIVESFRDWGRDCFCPPGKENTCGNRFGRKIGGLPQGYDHKYTYSHAGYNLKITDMQAAVGLAQLSRLDGFVKTRRDNHQRLASTLSMAGFEEFGFVQMEIAGAISSWFGFLIVLKNDCGTTRNDLTSYLEQNGIGTRLLFAGNATKQPYFNGREYRVVGALSNADILMENAFWVGCWPGMKNEEIDFIGEKILGYFGRAEVFKSV
jgi:CDP-6-deoxy-D-xylo-4-hexulose-3-dehydrase